MWGQAFFPKSFDFKNQNEVTHPKGDLELSENDVSMELPFVIRYVRWFITTYDWFMKISISLNHIVL